MGMCEFVRVYLCAFLCVHVHMCVSVYVCVDIKAKSNSRVAFQMPTLGLEIASLPGTWDLQTRLG